MRGFVNDPRKIVLIREGQGDPMEAGPGAASGPGIRDRIRTQAPFPEGTLIQAMTLGEQSEIPRAIQDRFNRTGTSHIIAISGFNVGIIALIAFFLIRTLLKTSEYPASAVQHPEALGPVRLRAGRLLRLRRGARHVDGEGPAHDAGPARHRS
ncbi:MAG: ComEC/Rec2 family competence protein [Desulfobacterales bacterium]|nr:ComEC/Rec2 family competence protein [Desulfobacterales bacterium]